MVRNKTNKDGTKTPAVVAHSGFKCFDLSTEVILGVVKKGYKNPTPIQRKCIPIILSGKDVVAMARTGSGKTACFLLPLLNSLKCHQPNGMGPRGLILSPTRELALQTFQVFKELAKYTGLRAAVIIGGDSMDRNFESLHSEQPDVLIATPGRLTHVLVEMEMKLHNASFFILDEADRLFELGFAEQINLISKQMKNSRQTLLFSATLPQSITEFTRVGLHDPELIRLNKDEKLSELLKLHYIVMSNEQKIPFLLYFLNEKMTQNEKTAVFLPTKHHVEYLHELLDAVNIENTYIYSSLDQECRRENIEKFTMRGFQCNVLLVTDIAARGIDIPVMDNVINFNFPASPKLFVHRVGRVARGGKSGTALCMMSIEEVPYYIDVQMFLGKEINFANSSHSNEDVPSDLLGAVNKDVLFQYSEKMEASLNIEGSDLETLSHSAERALSQYKKTNNPASHESCKRAKEMNLEQLQIHPLLRTKSTDSNVQDFVNSLKNYKSRKTIFEVNFKNNTQSYEVMRETRKRHSKMIETFADKKKQKLSVETPMAPNEKAGFVHFQASNHHFEKGLEISQFENELKNSTFDVAHDDQKVVRENVRSKKMWDRKKKRMVGTDGNKEKTIVTESGVRIKASYKTGLYDKWLQTSQQNAAAASTEDGGQGRRGEFERFVQKNKHNKGDQNELKSMRQVKSNVKKKNDKFEFDARRHKERQQRKASAKSSKKTGGGRKGGKFRKKK